MSGPHRKGGRKGSEGNGVDGRTEEIVIGDEEETWWSRNKNPRESCDYEKRVVLSI